MLLKCQIFDSRVIPVPQKAPQLLIESTKEAISQTERHQTRFIQIKPLFHIKTMPIQNIDIIFFNKKRKRDGNVAVFMKIKSLDFGENKR